MPAELEYVGTIRTGSFELPTSTVSMTVVGQGPAARIAVADYAFGATQELDLNGAGLPRSGDPDWHLPAGRVAVDVAGISGASLPQSVIDTAQASWEAGNRDGQLAYLGPGGRHDTAATVLAAQVGGQDLLFVAPMDASGITAFTLDAEGTPGAREVRGDSNTQHLGNVADLAVAETASGSYLYAGSASEHGLNGYRIGPGGDLSPVAHLGRDERLPVQTVTALETAEVAGGDFLIAAAAGSSSLTVLSVAGNGALGVTDHLIDDRDTRFAGAVQLEVITVAGHVFVLAAGRDDGLSLFALSPDGRLVHLDTLADTEDMALAGLSGLAAQEVPGGFEVVTTSGSEAGLSLFRVDFADPGLVETQGAGRLDGTAGDDMLALTGGDGTIAAGAGDDIVLDGPGADRLTGGSGADTFVLAADGARDVIVDIRPGQDRLDLSAWGFLYSVDQLDVQSTSWGAVVGYGDEELELRSFDGAALDAGDMARLLPVMLSRIAVQTGTLQEAAPPPDPEPFPDSVPEPDPLPEPQPEPEPESEPEPSPAPSPAPPLGRSLSGGSGADSIAGGMGDDSIDGGAGNDTLHGGAGDDGIKGRAGHDLIYGGAGDDRLPGEDGDDTIRGEDGSDRLGGGVGDDLMIGGPGNDRGGGGPGDDTLRGEAEDDWFSGGSGSDLVQGGIGNDRLAGSFGHDTVEGGAGDDTMGGGNGDDVIVGGAGNDVIGAGGRHDLVLGEDGDDYLGGGAGDDRLRGGAGDDTLNGGYGADTLAGGEGADLFVFNALQGGGTAILRDFAPGEDLMRLVGRPLGNDPLDRLEISDDRAAGTDAARIEYGDHTIYVLDITAAELRLDDFVFL